MSAVSRRLLVLILILSGTTRAGDTQTALNYGDVPLQESDLREITVQLVSSYPELASSPGVKYYEAEQEVTGSVTAGVVYLPHAESAGIRKAVGVLPSEMVLAVAEAARAALPLHPGVDPAERCEAVAISRTGHGPGVPDGYLVSMNCTGSDRTQSIIMLATETPNADLTQPSNWHVGEYVPPQLHWRDN